MTESMPPTLVQMQKMQRDLAEKVLDKACEDPQWKQQLIEDPQLAMRQANFPEAQQLRQAAQQIEVQGQLLSGGGGWGGGNFFFSGGWGGGGNFFFSGGWGGGGWGGGGWGGGNFFFSGGWGGGGNFWWGWW